MLFVGGVDAFLVYERRAFRLTVKGKVVHQVASATTQRLLRAVTRWQVPPLVVLPEALLTLTFAEEVSTAKSAPSTSKTPSWNLLS